MRKSTVASEGARRRRTAGGGSSLFKEDDSYAPPSLLTRGVNSVFAFVRLAEFEILFVLFFLVAFLLFKDLMSRPGYNEMLVRKSGGGAASWP